jgi:hypothetical protein
VYPGHPQSNHEEILSRATGALISYTNNRSYNVSPSCMSFVFPNKCPLMRFSGVAIPCEETDTRYRFRPQYSYIPAVDDFLAHDPYLWKRLQKAGDEFEEFKDHLRRIKTLTFNWLVTSYLLILFFTWCIIVRAFSASYRLHFLSPHEDVHLSHGFPSLRLESPHRVCAL